MELEKDPGLMISLGIHWSQFHHQSGPICPLVPLVPVGHQSTPVRLSSYMCQCILPFP